MVEPVEPGLTVAEAALLLGISHDAIHKRIKRSQLRAWKEGGEWRVVVPPKTIPVEVEPDPQLPAVMSSEPTGQLAALSDYNRRLIEPWAARVRALETQQLRDREEIGDLKRQVKEHRRALAGMERALRQLASSEAEA